MEEATASSRACPSCGEANAADARFCSNCGTRVGEIAPQPGLRKTVTILFCDATSSTALGEQLDPESVRGLMTRYFAVMRDVIEFHGGTVEKFIGDAVMAVFGVPTVHEDDALRACRAAVEIRERLGAMDQQMLAERGTTVEWRIGINTGEVVVGELTGQRLVTGDPVNVAARLEAAAAPGETLLGATTHALVREAVVAEATEPLALKGKAKPTPAWRLVSVAGGTHRQPRPLEAPLVGRRRPLRLLEDAFSEAVEERVCHLFTVLGAAGVGKSRLIEEFVDSVPGALVATGRCLAYGHGITFWPVAEALRQALGVAEGAPAEVVDRRLREVLVDEPDAARIALVVAALIGLNDETVAPEEVFWAIRKTCEALASDRPMILVFDDVHWGERTFLDLIDHLTDWARDAPILLIVMARPELLERHPGWGGGKRWVTTITLEPLSEADTEELLLALLGRAELSAELRAQISAASEGIPLFVEELLGKLVDDGFLVAANEVWSVSKAPVALTIPATIQALLAARLDGLTADERAVIERAAVEGKVFHRGAVTELAPELVRPHVRDRLASLMRMELVRPDSPAFAGDEAFRFRHLLIRDAAYQALAKQTRSELHERFAEWLERVAGDRRTEFQEIIGYHLEQAYRYRVELGPVDDAARAVALRAGMVLADAGDRAARLGDAAATVDLLGRALEMLPEPAARLRRLAFRFGNALYEAGQAQRAEKVLETAVTQAEAADDEAAAALASVALSAVRSSTQSTALEQDLRDLQRAAAVLDQSGDLDGARMAQAHAAFTLFAMGRAAEALGIAQQVVDAGPSDEDWYERALQSQGAALVYGPTPITEAVTIIEAHAEPARGPYFAAGPLVGIGRLRAWEGRFAEARDMLVRARRGFEELGNRHHVASAYGAEAEAAYLSGDISEAAKAALRGYEAMVATGDQSYASTQAVLVARTLLDVDDLEGAGRYAQIALDTSAADDVVSQAGGRSLEALVLARRGEPRRAIPLARRAEVIMDATDYLVQHGEVRQDLAIVLDSAGDRQGALAEARAASALYEAKGATAFVHRVDRLIAAWT